jgi:hypothetical protein
MKSRDYCEFLSHRLSSSPPQAVQAKTCSIGLPLNRGVMSPRVPMRAFLPIGVFLAILLSAVVPVLSQQATPLLVTQAVDNTVRTALPGNLHPLARSEFDQGEAPPDLALDRMILVLRRSPQQEEALRRLIENQQYKHSANYHRWLAPAEFGVQFGPADSDVQAVIGWLSASGFQVTQVSNSRTFIEFSGTAALVEQAFGTAIHSFVVNGEQHWANVSNPSIPTALSPVVAGINSLNNFRKRTQNNFVGTYSEQTKNFVQQPEYTFPSGGYTYYAVVPYDFAAIYNLLPLWNATPTPINGTGQTIAIVGRTDVDPSDATTFWNLFGLDGVNAPQPNLVITHNGPAPGINGDEGEADIDIQWSGAAAPGATINFVTSESTETTDGVDLSALYIVDNNLAPVMSESYGLCEPFLGSGGVGFYGALWEQAAAQGISVFVSSGDNGSAGCDNPGAPAQYGLNVNGLASTPFNAAVGGTDFNEYQKWSTYWNSTNDPVTQKSAKGYIPETTWNDSCTNSLLGTLSGGSTSPETNCNNVNFVDFLESIAGSGGKSKSWQKPSWQTGTPNDSARDLPDISLFASNGFVGSFYVVCQKDATGGSCNLNNFAGYGGTSVASPAFAGIMALVNQKTGSAQGVPGFVLYKLASKQPSAFHDVPSGSTISVPCLTGTANCTTSSSGHSYGVLSGYNTGTGYDLATGLGSVDAANLVNNWAAVTFTPSATTLILNSGTPVNITHGAQVPVRIAVAAANPPSTPMPTGDVALLVSPGTPGNAGIDGFTLAGGAVNGTTNVLPGGNYSVVAHYAGDTTYGGSYSAPVGVTVNPESSSVYMPGVVIFDNFGNPSYSNSVVYGSPYLLRADVKNSQGKFCNPPPTGEMACPTGNIAFTDNGTPLDDGSYQLNTYGYAEDQLIQLTGGAHTIGAHYGGDASFNASSTSAAVTVTPANTNMANLYFYGATVGNQLSVSVYVNGTGSGVPPTGTVTFYANGTPMVGPVTYTPYNPPFPPEMNASINTTTSPFPNPGTYTISASYSGDANYTPSTAPGQTINVMFPMPTVYMQSSSYSVNAGTSITLTATVIGFSKTIAPTGTISINGSQGPAPGTISYSTVTNSSTGNLDLQGTITFTPAYTDNYTSNYSGDSDFPGAFGSSGTVTVTGNDFTLSLPAPATMTVPQGSYGQLNNLVVGIQTGSAPVTFSATACSGMPAETTCGVAPASATYTTTLQINVTTTAPHTLAVRAQTRSFGWWPGGFVTTLLAVVFLPGVSRKRRRWTSVFAVVVIALLTLIVGCGGGSSTPPPPPPQIDPGTPKGTYTITVSGTNGTATHTTTFSLIVQ